MNVDEETPEMVALRKQIEKIDKKVDWREKRIKQDRADIEALTEESEKLRWSYRRLNMINRGEDPDA